jgi:hypothetical protein
MTEDKVVKIIRNYLEGLFPKVCPCCKRMYASLREYLQVTDHVGSVPYDADARRSDPYKPIGTVTLANCTCGSTMALSSKGMPIFRYWSLLNWARIETQKRQLTPKELLNSLLDEIFNQVLAELGMQLPE